MSKVQEVIEIVKGLTVLELSELVKELEETFGVSAAAPVAVAAAAADMGRAVDIHTLAGVDHKADDIAFQKLVDLLRGAQKEGAFRGTLARRGNFQFLDEHSDTNLMETNAWRFYAEVTNGVTGASSIPVDAGPVFRALRLKAQAAP